MALRYTILTCAWNAVDTLPRALDSALAQRSPHGFEVLVMDDYSTDATPRLLADYQARFPDRLRCVRNPRNLRLGGARNAGIKIARGDFIWLLDADDSLEPGAMAVFDAAMESRSPDDPMPLMVGGHFARFADGRRRRISAPRFGASRLDNFRRYMSGDLSKPITLACIMPRIFCLQYPYGEKGSVNEEPTFSQALARLPYIAVPDVIGTQYKSDDSLRHRQSLDSSWVEQQISNLFDGPLPAELQRYRAHYRARNYLSIARRLARQSGKRSLARRALWSAVGARPALLLSLRFWSRCLKIHFRPPSAP